MIHPERGFAAEVIRAAIEDVTDGVPTSVSTHRNARIRVAKESRRFLTATWGPWAISRQTWCDIAGIDPDALRERAVRMIARPEVRA